MKIYTKTGDQGETSLMGGQRVSKNHSRIDAYGTVDELNSILGMIRAIKPHPVLASILEQIQNELFVLGADLATPPDKNNRIDRINKKNVRQIEQDIDRLDATLDPLKTFILPGGSIGAAHLHHARTVCRRAERITCSCRQSEIISDEALIFLNRLSDLLYVMARYQNKSEDIDDVAWSAR